MVVCSSQSRSTKIANDKLNVVKPITVSFFKFPVLWRGMSTSTIKFWFLIFCYTDQWYLSGKKATGEILPVLTLRVSCIGDLDGKFPLEKSFRALCSHIGSVQRVGTVYGSIAISMAWRISLMEQFFGHIFWYLSRALACLFIFLSNLTQIQPITWVKLGPTSSIVFWFHWFHSALHEQFIFVTKAKGPRCPDSSQNPISPCDVSQNDSSPKDISQNTLFTEGPFHRIPNSPKDISQKAFSTDSTFHRI